MTPDEAHQLMTVACNAARQILAATGEFEAMFHYCRRNGETAIVLAPMGDDRSKDFTMHVLRHKLAQDDAVWVMSIIEAWYVHRKPEHFNHDERASQAADRREAIIIHLEHEDGVIHSARADISRGPQNQAILGPLQFEPLTEISGRMVGLLPRTKKAN